MFDWIEENFQLILDSLNELDQSVYETITNSNLYLDSQIQEVLVSLENTNNLLLALFALMTVSSIVIGFVLYRQNQMINKLLKNQEKGDFEDE